MSEGDPKPIEDEPAPSGKQDPSTEAEDKSTEEEACNRTENENPSTEDEPAQVGEESSSTENGIPSLEDESILVEEEIPSLEDDSSLTIVGTVKQRRPTIDKEDPTIEEVSPTDEREDTAPDEELPTDKEDDSTIEEWSSDEDEEVNELDTPTEKQCQTIKVKVAYVEPKLIEEDIEFIDEEAGDGFNEKASQTLITADGVSEAEETLTHSCNASIETDSGNSLEGCPSIEEDPLQVLLKLTAQVMFRSSWSGGWLPEGRGGLSNVTMVKILNPPEKRIETGYKYTYNITAIRIDDSRKAMDCTLGDDFEYNKVMPTFHHWATGGTRYGLSFTSLKDAKVFDQTMRKAAHHHMLEKDPKAEPVKCAGDGDDYYMAFLDKKKRASPTFRRRQTPEAIPPLPLYEPKIEFSDITSPPKYMFRHPRGIQTPPRTQDLRQRPKRWTRHPLRTRLRCKYCHKLYKQEDNSGQCLYAPSTMRNLIDDVSCMQCARWFVQSCMVDPQSEYSNPCTCSLDGYCGMRWIGLCIASIFIPCLMLYPPMTACYRCGVHFGVCGGRHEPKDAFDGRIFY